MIEHIIKPANVVLAGSAVTQLLDTSGNGNHTAVQGTAGARPTYVANSISGKPGIRFNGSSNFLNLATLALGANVTWIFVASSAVNATNHVLIDVSSGSRMLLWGQAGTQAFAAGTATNATVIDATGEIIVAKFSTTAGADAVSVNANAFVTGGTLSAPITSSSVVLGARFSADQLWWSGDMALIGGYTRILTAGEIATTIAAVRADRPVY